VRNAKPITSRLQNVRRERLGDNNEVGRAVWVCVEAAAAASCRTAQREDAAAGAADFLPFISTPCGAVPPPAVNGSSQQPQPPRQTTAARRLISARVGRRAALMHN